MSLSALVAGPPFPEQVSSDTLIQDVFYAVATIAMMLVLPALCLVDGGGIRRKNMVHTMIGKVVAAVLAGGSFLVIGMGVWEWQFYQAHTVPHAFIRALHDWWIGGPNLRQAAQFLDPKAAPEADVSQVFVAFSFVYAAALGALIHSAGVERVKPLVTNTLCVIGGGIVLPLLMYLEWGSCSPLTNRGLHDDFGLYSLYVFAGTWSLVLAWRAKPRLGVFEPDDRTSGPAPHNLGLTATGIGLLLAAIPMIVVGCGYFVPGQGYFGISVSPSSFGLTFTNVFASYTGGLIGGGLLWRWTRNPTFVLYGPIAGYVSTSACLDIIHPWVAVVISLFSPAAFYLVYMLLRHLRIDEFKIAPLGLGSGAYGAVASGFAGWNTPTGGYFGLTGDYAAMHARVTPAWQLLGLAVTVAIAGVIGLALILVLERTAGLRISEQLEIDGLDTSPLFRRPVYPPPRVNGQLEVPAGGQVKVPALCGDCEGFPCRWWASFQAVRVAAGGDDGGVV